jgi:hypothetical protein
LWIYDHSHRRSRIFLRCSQFLHKRQPGTGSSNDWFCYGTVRDVHIDGPLHEGLVQPHRIIMLFLGSFFVQLFWTSRKTLRNRRFLDPHDLITKRKYVLRLQLELILNFFVKLCNPYLEPDSMIPRLVNFRLSRYNNDNEKKILFVRSSLAGWLIGKIFSFIFFHEIVGIHSDHNDLGTKELF